MLLMSGIAREAIYAALRRRLTPRRGRQSGRWQEQETLDMMQRGGWMAPPRPAPPTPLAAPAARRTRSRSQAARGAEGPGCADDAEFSAEKTKLLAVARLVARLRAQVHRRRLDAVAGAELAQDALDVGLGGRLGDHEAAGDLVVGLRRRRSARAPRARAA